MFIPRQHSLWQMIWVAMIATMVMACNLVYPNGSYRGSADKYTTEGIMVMSILDQAATMSVEDYSPAYIIEAVNTLHPQGKEKALEQIESYLEHQDKKRYAYGLFWVLRVLFEVPAEQGYPPVRIGQPNIPPPTAPEKLPRFPIVMIHDIPFLPVSAYVLGGKAENVEVHVAYFRAYGTLREHPLTPPALMDGIEMEFVEQWQAAYGNAYLAEALNTIQSQIARLLG